MFKIDRSESFPQSYPHIHIGILGPAEPIPGAANKHNPPDGNCYLTTTRQRPYNDNVITKGKEKMIAQTIARQIGTKALFMIGAKRLLDAGNGLAFKVGRNAKGVNYIKIILETSDTYTMQAYSARGIDLKLKKELTGVYCDQLNTGIETLTGMFTRL
jgi:hypothetical protein